MAQNSASNVTTVSKASQTYLLSALEKDCNILEN